MATTHISVGFTGTVDQTAEAQRFDLIAQSFRVASASDWATSVVTTADRTVQIAAGSGQACGVLDTTSAADTVQLPANSGSSTRYDAIVATFNWASTPPAVTFGSITGGTQPPPINTTGAPDPTTIDRLPGVQYDALLAIARVAPGQGALGTSDLFGLAPWGGNSGPMLVPQTSYMRLLDASPGSMLTAMSYVSRPYHLDPSSGSWYAGPPHSQLVVNFGWAFVNGHNAHAYVVPSGNVRYVGWCTNQNAFSLPVASGGTQVTPCSIATSGTDPRIPVPQVNQAVLVPFNSPNGGGLVVGTILVNTGTLRLEYGVAGPSSFPGNYTTQFFLDGIEFNPNYYG